MAKTTKSKGFFALDVHQFERIRGAGLGIEEAAAYLCLLTSTDQSNVASSGGINSIMSYSGLSRAEAKRAVRNLEDRRLIECVDVERKRARTVVRHKLPVHDSRRPISAKERAVYEAIEAGKQPASASEVQAAHRAKDKGWVEKRSDGWQVIEHTNEVAFIPNVFVRGSDGHSPLYRLVNNGELGPLMLAAELYQLQNLMDHRGVPMDMVRAFFSPYHQARIGQHKIHHLNLGRSYEDPKTGEEKSFIRVQNHRWRGEGFWDSLAVLDAAHVVEWTVYSANGKPSASDCYATHRPQRPLGVLRNGKQVLRTPESKPAFMAYLLWCLHQGQGQLHRETTELIEEWRTASPVVAVENTSVSHVEGVGILRMVHRADTENVKVWYRDLCQECDQAFFFIKQVAQEKYPQVSDMIRTIQTQANLTDAISMEINDSSTTVQ